MLRTLALAVALCPILAFADVHYTVKVLPASRSVQVTVSLTDPGTTEVFRIPAWCPGYYQIENYQNAINSVKAFSIGGYPLPVKRSGDRAWTVTDAARTPYSLSYRVRGDDAGLGFFAVCVHERDAFINGPSAFMTADGRMRQPITLNISVPSGWDVATPLDQNSTGEFVAGGYDEFLDSPIQLGRFVRRRFKVGAIPFEAIYVSPSGKINANVDAESARMEKLSEPAIALFGGAPFKHYTYFIHLAPGNFSGGLEHRASTVLAVANSRTLDMDDLITHEFFHAWNVKQIRPFVLGPFDYTQPARTNNLWFAEGVTDYYAKLTAYESGLEDTGWLLSSLTSAVANLQQGTTRKSVTLEQSSHEAWENGEEGVGDLSYYDKGLLVGLLLDAEIRSGTGGSKSLDDVMRLLYVRHRLPLPGYGEKEIRDVVSEVAERDLSKSYDRMVASTEELPYGELRSIGLLVLLPGATYPDAGFMVDEKGVVTQVSAPAKELGLDVGDNVSVTAVSAASANVTLTRGSKNLTLTIPLKLATADEYQVEFDPLASDGARALLDRWLAK